MNATSMILIALMSPLQPAKPENPDGPPKAEAPKDVASLLGAIAFTETKMYFETAAEGRPIGYQVSSLTPVKGKEAAAGEGDVAYEYRAESILTRDNGMRIDSVTIARLKRNFEPISITVDRQLSHPEAAARHIEDRVQVGESQVTVAHEDSMASTKPVNSLPKLDKPFVYGMEFVIEALNVTKNAKFPIAELNPQEGTVSVYKVVAGQKEGGTQEMVLQKDDGGIGYRFKVGPEGRIESWASSDLPAMMKRVPEERFNEVRKSIEGK